MTTTIDNYNRLTNTVRPLKRAHVVDCYRGTFDAETAGLPAGTEVSVYLHEGRTGECGIYTRWVTVFVKLPDSHRVREYGRDYRYAVAYGWRYTGRNLDNGLAQFAESVNEMRAVCTTTQDAMVATDNHEEGS